MAGQGYACRFPVSFRMVAAASAIGLAAGLVAGLAVPQKGGLAPARGALPSARLTAWGTASASALAASAGQPVEVLSDRTDYAQTFADPDGGFTLDESASPVRVQQPDGSWVPVDPLAQQPDGSYAPAAITAGLKLSGVPCQNPQGLTDLLFYARRSCSFASSTCSWSRCSAGGAPGAQ